MIVPLSISAVAQSRHNSLLKINFKTKMSALIKRTLLATAVVVLSSCSQSWNNPYPQSNSDQNIYYSAFDERPKHLDPARSYSSNEWAFLSQIYEPPLQYHFLKRPYELTTLTAESMPSVNYLDAKMQPTDELQAVAYTDYVIRLKRGIQYQPHPAFATQAFSADWQGLKNVHTLNDFPNNGSREATAEDYVYQIKRLASPELHSPIAGLMKEHIVGFEAFQQLAEAHYATLKKQTDEKRPWLDLRELHMEGVEIIDRYSFRIRIEGRYPQFIYWLAMNFFSPMPWEAERFYHLPGLHENNITLDWYPVGTGPYMLAENNPNLRMVLERNPNFRGEAYPHEGMPEDMKEGSLDDAGKPMPFIDRAIYSLEKESIPRWNKFLQGYYDLSGIGSDSFDQAVQFGSGGEVMLTDEMRMQGIELQTSTSTSIFYFGFNMKDTVVGGDSERARLLRRAISIAIDFEEYISIFRNGRGLPAQGPLPPGIFGYRDGAAGINPVVFENHDGKPVRRSINEAKALLKQAGYENGLDPQTGSRLTLYYDTTATGPDSKASLNWYRKQFQKLGIELVIRASDYNRFQDKMAKGTAQLFSWGWNADYPDPENFLFLLYGPNSRVDHHGENAANYHNAEFDALFDSMKFLPNGEQRQQVIDSMVDILRHDAPWVWGFIPVDYVLRHSWYHNAKPNLMANNTLKYRRINVDLRKQERLAWNPPILTPLIVLGVLFFLSLLPAFILYRRHERSKAR